MAKPSTSKFANMPPSDRRRAQAVLNGYREQVNRWTEQSEELVDTHDLLDLWLYVGFNDTELEQYFTADQFIAAVRARQEMIDERVKAMKARMKQRSQVQHQRARERARKARDLARKAGDHALEAEASRILRAGRPAEGQLTYGSYVYFATAYNHGYGAEFRDYGATKGGTAADPTPITRWSGYVNTAPGGYGWWDEEEQEEFW